MIENSSTRKKETLEMRPATWLPRMGQVSHAVSTFVYYIQKKDPTVAAAEFSVHKSFPSLFTL